MSEVQTVSAVVHEIAHSKLHNQKKIEEPKNAAKYQEVEIFDIPALFSNGRIAAADIPEGLYRYDLRGSDYDPGMPVTVENNVSVNHAGSILTAKPLELGNDGRLRLTDEGWDYSLYDKETKKLIDGGILDPADIENSPVSSLAGAARTSIGLNYAGLQTEI